jgi:acyl-coenzyme A synthetase/AMP-(fatty) acid ligase
MCEIPDSPLKHASPQEWASEAKLISLTAQLRVGFRIVLIESFDAERSPQVMADHGATVVGSAIPLFHAYLNAQHALGPEPLFPSLRMAMSGGAPIPPELAHEVKRELGGAGSSQVGG